MNFRHVVKVVPLGVVTDHTHMLWWHGRLQDLWCNFFPMGTVSVNSGLSCRLDTLREKNAVKILVNCAYARKGTSASRNAAIAAAKLTKDAKCLQQLRECNGLEIIHNYVRI